MRATLNLPYDFAGAKGSLKHTLLKNEMQKNLAMATGHPRNLFIIVNVSPTSSIVMDMIILPQSIDAGGGVNLVSPMDVLCSPQQKIQTSLREEKLMLHMTGIEQIQPYALDEDAEKELSALAQERSGPEASEALLHCRMLAPFKPRVFRTEGIRSTVANEQGLSQGCKSRRNGLGSRKHACSCSFRF